MSADANDCVDRSKKALQDITAGGHVFIDAGREILGEYQRNILTKGERGVGTLFLKWLLTHEYNEARVTRVQITRKKADPSYYEELPPASDGARYDPSDHKFLAVAAAHAEHPPILQAGDSKWWGWQKSLARCGVTIFFLCPEEAEAKYKKKMRRR